MPELKIIRNYTERENSHTLESYVSSGGYKALDKALTLQPEEIIETIKRSGLRGRGGAGTLWGPPTTPIRLFWSSFDW